MSLVGMLQNFISQVNGIINSDSNPLGLEPGQIDLINQVLKLIKNLISDGIQKGDLVKLIALLGDVAEVMPDLSDDVKEIVQEIKNIYKKLFLDSDSNSNSALDSDKLMQSNLLEIATDSNNEDTLPGANPLLNGISNPLFNATKKDGLDSSMLNKTALADTKEARYEVAEKVLNFLNDNLVLSKVNFDVLIKGLKKIKNRSDLTPPTQQDDYRINDVSSKSSYQ